MNIALTGSSGLIGSFLKKDLKNAGYDVLCISSSKSIHNENIYTYEEILERKINLKADLIIHLASINSNLNEYQIDEELNLSKKVFQSMCVLDCKKIIFFSSIKVYGENSFAKNKYTEESLLKPESFYGEAKKKCENFFIKKASDKNFSYFILRLSPLILESSGTNIGKFFYLVRNGFPLPSFQIGNNNKRSFLSYENLIKSLFMILNMKIIIQNEIFNLADPDSISTHSLINEIGIIVGRKPKIINLPNFLFNLMMRVNRLQSILNRVYGDFNISCEKFKNTFSL